MKCHLKLATDRACHENLGRAESDRAALDLLTFQCPNTLLLFSFSLLLSSSLFVSHQFFPPHLSSNTRSFNILQSILDFKSILRLTILFKRQSRLPDAGNHKIIVSSRSSLHFQCSSSPWERLAFSRRIGLGSSNLQSEFERRSR